MNTEVQKHLAGRTHNDAFVEQYTYLKREPITTCGLAHANQRTQADTIL